MFKSLAQKIKTPAPEPELVFDDPVITTYRRNLIAVISIEPAFTGRVPCIEALERLTAERIKNPEFDAALKLVARTVLGLFPKD